LPPLTDYLSRRGEVLVLLLVVLLSVTLMLLSSSRQDALARSLNDAALTPVQVLVRRAQGLVGLRAENDALRAELARARLEVAALGEEAREAERLQRMLGFREGSAFTLLSARVIAREASRPGAGYKIDRGARDGVREELAVVTPDGLVGKVVSAEPRSAWVRPILARSCRVSVRLELTRVDGILDWSPQRGLHLTFVPSRAQASVGDTVITTGLGGVFPRGVRVGQVTGVDTVSADGSLRLAVQPAVDFAALEDVFVILVAPDAEAEVPPPGDARTRE
jgi:rod shape-determining protein MreC